MMILSLLGVKPWKSVVKVNAAMLPLVGLACLYISNEQQADTPAGRAKQVAEALKSATAPAEQTDATNIKRPDVMAALKTVLKPHAPQDGTVYTTVLVTGPVGSGKTVALREALSSEKGVVISYAFSSAKGDYVEAWCSSLLVNIGAAEPQPRSRLLRSLGLVKPEEQVLESAEARLEAGLRALKQEYPGANLPILVAEADGSVTPQQLSELLHQFKVWAARNRLAKCVLVVPSAQAAHITWHDQSAMRLWPVVIGDLTDDQAVA
jgi:hypothetical protein